MRASRIATRAELERVPRAASGRPGRADHDHGSVAACSAASRCGARSWQRIFESGRQVAGSILGLDITGEDVDATGLVWDTGDADMTARPIAGTLQRAPWLAAPTGQLMLTMFDGAGAPAAADPRHALVRVVERFAARGLTPVVACELEFYLLDRKRRWPAGARGRRPRQRAPARSTPTA